MGFMTGKTGKQLSDRAQWQLWQIREKWWFAGKTASAPASLDLCGRLSVGGAGELIQAY
jgi:hypothetical protein